MELEQLIQSLKEHKVDFVIIGATAFPVHGYSRATLDTDIFIRPTKNNAKKTLMALKSFGYDVSSLSINDILTKKILIRQYVIETDIHPFVKGISFMQVWKNKIKSKIGNITAYFASLRDLIRMKKSANRAKDKEDLKYLIRLLKTKK